MGSYTFALLILRKRLTYLIGIFWLILEKNGIRGKMYKAVKRMYEVVRARVRVGGDLTEAFICSRGLKQGDSCSPFLFSLLINEFANETVLKGKHGITLSP